MRLLAVAVIVAAAGSFAADIAIAVAIVKSYLSHRSIQAQKALVEMIALLLLALDVIVVAEECIMLAFHYCRCGCCCRRYGLLTMNLSIS